MQLVGGTTPNEGRVEVKYDDVWSSVCYKKPETYWDTRTWIFNNAEVVCRELGFPGTMFARQGGQGIGLRQSVVTGYKCIKSRFSLKINLYSEIPKLDNLSISVLFVR